ncbi:hypothetical protein LINPERHAP2_LOCUS28751 [Linum perenne]
MASDADKPVVLKDQKVVKKDKVKSVWQEKVVATVSTTGNEVESSLQDKASPEAEAGAVAKPVLGNGIKSPLGEKETPLTNMGEGMVQHGSPMPIQSSEVAGDDLSSTSSSDDGKGTNDRLSPINRPAGKRGGGRGRKR